MSSTDPPSGPLDLAHSQPLPDHGWTALSAQSPLVVMEQDLRRLMAEASAVATRANDDRQRGLAEQRKQLLSLLEIVDGFDRVLADIAERGADLPERARGWVDSFHTLRAMLGRLLAASGVRVMEALDRELDPEHHHALATVGDPSRPDGMIVEVVRPGYFWNDVLLRAADVIVVKNER